MSDKKCKDQSTPKLVLLLHVISPIHIAECAVWNMMQKKLYQKGVLGQQELHVILFPDFVCKQKQQEDKCCTHLC